MDSRFNSFRTGSSVMEAQTPKGVVRPGDRVLLQPQGDADIWDLTLLGKTATIEAIEQDMEDQLYLAVTVDDDPGRDLGQLRKPAHCFFFRPEEVEPLPSEPLAASKGTP